MDHPEQIISSSWTTSGFFIALVVCILMLPVFALIFMSEPFHWGMLIGSLIYLFAIGYLYHQATMVCEARIKGNQIYLKRIFQSEQAFTVDQIQELSSFRVKRTKYTVLEMKTNATESETFWILNSRTLGDRPIDAESIITSWMEGNPSTE